MSQSVQIRKFRTEQMFSAEFGVVGQPDASRFFDVRRH
jgi:hypothetical protein